MFHHLDKQKDQITFAPELRAMQSSVTNIHFIIMLLCGRRKKLTEFKILPKLIENNAFFGGGGGDLPPHVNTKPINLYSIGEKISIAYGGLCINWICSGMTADTSRFSGLVMTLFQ